MDNDLFSPEPKSLFGEPSARPGTTKTAVWGDDTVKSARDRFQSARLRRLDSDDDIPTIPDVEDIQDEYNIGDIAEAPRVATNFIPSLSELNADLNKQSLFKVFEGINISILSDNLYKESEIKEEKPEVEGEFLQVTTHEKEKYRCKIPTLKEKEESSDEDYNGPNPIELLAPLFESSLCSSLLESYWMYELCHGRYIRQYHEEREGKKFKLQEYILGRWDKSMTAKLSAEFDAAQAAGKPLIPPQKKLDGISLPYVQLNFTDGTLCDLNGKPRRTAVLYVCFSGTKNDIFLIKEISTCEYEAIVISSELCKHPKYRPQVTGSNEISCRPLDGASRKPMSLIQMETEVFKQKHHISTFGDAKNDKMFAVYSIDEYKDKDGRTQVRVELRPVDEPELPSALESPAPTAPDVPLPVQDFLSGKGCIEGGSGWWKYKFCYGQSVEQYHVEKTKDGREHKISISLGTFDKENHLDWLKRNKNKKPKSLPQRTFVSHYYSNGDPCETTGKLRETEVKLKCVAKKGTVSVYLLEPHICQYILGIESPLVCEFLDKIDEDTGLMEDNYV